MKRSSAQGVATRKNRAAQKKAPLFAATGTLEDIVPAVTVEEVLERHAAGQGAASGWQDRMAERDRAVLAETVAYAVDVLGHDTVEGIIEAVRSRVGGTGDEYVADALTTACARHEERRPLDVHCDMHGVRNVWAEYEARQAKRRWEEGTQLSFDDQ